MSRPVVFRFSGQRDIADAYRWYEGRQPNLGTAFLDEIDKVEQLVSSEPELFNVIRGDVRRAILHRFPYALFYVIRPEFVSVLAILHHARHPKAWQGRR